MRYINNKFTIEKINVENIAKNFCTPFYCYSHYQLKKNIINFKKKQYDDALINFRNALIINPKNHMVLLNIGITHFRLRKNKIAIKNIKESVLLNDKNEAAYYNLGVIYEVEDDLDMAMEAYNKVISLNPKHHDA